MRKLFQRYNTLSPNIKAAIWFTICVFLQKGVTVISTPIFTRLMSPSEYGEFNVFNSWMEIVTIFVSLKLFAGVYVQGLVKFDEQKNEFASSLQGLSVTLTLAWTVIYFIFKDFWNGLFSLTTVQMLSMLIMIWATSAFNFWAASQRVNLKYRALVIVTAISSVAKPGIGVLFVINANDKVTARILGLALVELVCYSVLFVVQIYRGKKFYSRKFWKYALLFNLPLVPHYLSTTVLNSADRIMIKQLVGADEAGIYSVNYQISQLMTLLSNALEQSIQPWLFQKIKIHKIEEIKKIVYPAFAAMVAVTAIVMLLAPEILAIFAPGKYREAVWVIPPVMISVYLVFSYTMFASFEFYFEKTQYIAAATVIGAILNIVLNYIFINLFGYMAAGYTTLFCFFIFSVFHYLFMRRICKKYAEGVYPYDTKIILLFFAILMGFGFVALLTYNLSFLRYLIILILLLAAIFKRKKIISEIKYILNAKKKQ